MTLSGVSPSMCSASLNDQIAEKQQKKYCWREKEERKFRACVLWLEFNLSIVSIILLSWDHIWIVHYFLYLWTVLDVNQDPHFFGNLFPSFLLSPAHPLLSVQSAALLIEQGKKTNWIFLVIYYYTFSQVHSLPVSLRKYTHFDVDADKKKRQFRSRPDDRWRKGN